MLYLFVCRLKYKNYGKNKDMPDKEVLHFLESHPDFFKEMGNIGMGHACTALSQLMSTQVNRSIPAVWTLTYDEAAGYFELFEGGSIGMVLGLHEDIGGAIVHIVSLPFASRLINVYFPGEVNTVSDIDELKMSIVQEMGNITTAAFVNSLASMTGLFIDISTPKFYVDLKSEVLSQHKAEKLLFIENRFLVDSGSVGSELIFIPKPDSLDVLKDKLSEKYKLTIN